jgi:hypothetical protein
MSTMRLKRRLLGRLVCFALVCLLQIRPSYGQQIWFVPRSGPGGAEDFYDLFESGAPWRKAARHVKVFEISEELQANASDEQMKKVFRGLRERHVALALDMLPLSGRGSNGCGFHVEGYSAPLQSLSLAKRVKALGGDVAYYTMDEPLYYGYFFSGDQACHSSVDDLVADIAEKIKHVRSQFPAAQIGEAEPVPAITKLGLVDLEKWLNAYQAATGGHLSYLRLDLDWAAQWQPQVVAIAKLLKRKGVHLQIIYNGSDRDSSDEEWTSHALAHANAFEAIVKPDVVAIQSWTVYPKHLLPEADPKTMTGLINQYLSTRVMK